MPNDSQKAVFRAVADNKAMFECLKEYFQLKFSGRIQTVGLDNEHIGSIARAQYEGLQKVEAIFQEIAACRSIPDNQQSINPAR